MVQSDFGFDARLKSYRIFQVPCAVLITGGLSVGLFGFPRADVPRVLFKKERKGEVFLPTC
jgi:hypothetical protein